VPRLQYATKPVLPSSHSPSLAYRQEFELSEVAGGGGRAGGGGGAAPPVPLLPPVPLPQSSASVPHVQYAVSPVLPSSHSLSCAYSQEFELTEAVQSSASVPHVQYAVSPVLPSSHWLSCAYSQEFEWSELAPPVPLLQSSASVPRLQYAVPPVLPSSHSPSLAYRQEFEPSPTQISQPSPATEPSLSQVIVEVGVSATSRGQFSPS
jgi:hypothetical protein